MKKILAILVLLLCFSSTNALLEKNATTEEIKKEFNENPDQIPKTFLKLIDNKKVNIHIDKRTYGFELKNKKIITSQNKTFEDPSLSIKTNERAIEALNNGSESFINLIKSEQIKVESPNIFTNIFIKIVVFISSVFA